MASDLFKATVKRVLMDEKKTATKLAKRNQTITAKLNVLPQQLYRNLPAVTYEGKRVDEQAQQWLDAHIKAVLRSITG